jgi:threonyl-tRNA synthetase
MINITLPDGSVRPYEAGITAHQIALSISEGLARNVLAAEVNGEVWDSARPIEQDSTVKLLTWNDAAGKQPSGTLLHTLWQRHWKPFIREQSLALARQ